MPGIGAVATTITTGATPVTAWGCGNRRWRCAYGCVQRNLKAGVAPAGDTCCRCGASVAVCVVTVSNS